MRNMRRHLSVNYIFSLIIAVISVLIYTSGALYSIPFITVNDYTSTTDFSGQEIVLIQKGDSEAYREPGFDDSSWQAVSLPSSWKNLYPGWTGICWYRLHIHFPEAIPQKTPGIRLGVISDIDSVFFNGQLIGSSGKFSPDRISSYDKKRLYEIPSFLIKPGEDNVLAVRVAGLFPFENGLFRGSFELGPFAELQQSIFFEDFFNLVFIIFYIAVAIYFGIVFGRKLVDKEYFVFAVFTLCSALYFFMWTQTKYFFTDNFLLLKRSEYILLFLILPLLMSFITNFFKKPYRSIHYIYFGIMLFASVCVITSNNILFWNRIMIYAVQPLWVVPIAYSVTVIIKEYKKDINAKYILASFIVTVILLLNDILVLGGIYEFYKLSIYGFAIIIFGIAKMMRSRFLELYGSSEVSQGGSTGRKSITSDARKKLDEALAYLQENFTDDISREGLAAALNISPDYLGRLFKQYIGKTMNEYINELRINRAADLLRRSNKSVTEIAFESGFESLATFYRVFQKITGMTPTAFQEKQSGK
ncbi:MAG: helix-turn-helix domain-containing protein [Spirochaetes bacterium]|nr:helix-turn-helix domain-containing protein [Spirochaetota bacterium]